VLKFFQEEYFLKALSSSEAQWIRRNKGGSTVVEAAEDYITPPKSSYQDIKESHLIIRETKEMSQRSQFAKHQLL
jgi:hypothetical protein